MENPCNACTTKRFDLSRCKSCHPKIQFVQTNASPEKIEEVKGMYDPTAWESCKQMLEQCGGEPQILRQARCMVCLSMCGCPGTHACTRLCVVCHEPMLELENGELLNMLRNRVDMYGEVSLRENEQVLYHERCHEACFINLQ